MEKGPDVSGRWVVVTGGTRGIGLATARRLAASGHRLVLGYRSERASADAVAAELGESTEVVTVRADLATEDGVADLFAALDGRGPLVGLVNNAGTLERQSPLAGIDRQRWRRVLEVNLVGLAECCRAAVSLLEHEGGGAIVNVSSRAAVLGSPGEYIDYAASKAGVDALTRGLALEVARLGIRVNAVRPGIIDTDLHAAGGEARRAHRLGAKLPLGRAGNADEVAAAIGWLLSDEASYVTGAILDVSGGR
jgi:NAD(P)-dependent dehydrogenase (short-subunit alcohol dehydrogenase family)